MISREKALEILKKKGIDLDAVLKSPQALNKACQLVYKAIPIPFRWFVGKKRIASLITSLSGAIPKK